MFGFEAYGTKYYGEGDVVDIVVSEYPIYITIEQADIYNITISVTGGGA